MLNFRLIAASLEFSKRLVNVRVGCIVLEKPWTEDLSDAVVAAAHENEISRLSVGHDWSFATAGCRLTQTPKRYLHEETTICITLIWIVRGKYDHLRDRNQCHYEKYAYQAALQIEKVFDRWPINQEWILFQLSFLFLNW